MEKLTFLQLIVSEQKRREIAAMSNEQLASKKEELINQVCSEIANTGKDLPIFRFTLEKDKGKSVLKDLEELKIPGELNTKLKQYGHAQTRNVKKDGDSWVLENEDGKVIITKEDKYLSVFVALSLVEIEKRQKQIRALYGT